MTLGSINKCFNSDMLSNIQRIPGAFRPLLFCIPPRFPVPAPLWLWDRFHLNAILLYGLWTIKEDMLKFFRKRGSPKTLLELFKGRPNRCGIGN
jgi:hypothetical protein